MFKQQLQQHAGNCVSNDHQKSKQWPQFLAVCSSTLLTIGCGAQTGWPSPTLPKLLDNDLNFKVTEEESSNIVMMAPLGYLIGSPLASLMLDRVGRKWTLLIMALPQIIQWLLIATSVNAVFLYVARFISGIADGAIVSSLSVYICEVSEPKIRGRLGASISIGVAFGGFLINAYGSYVSIRRTALISLSLPLIFIVTFVWMPESPYYFLMKDKADEARKSLRELRRTNNVEAELLQLTADVQRQLSEPGSIKDVFKIETNLRAFLLLLGLRTSQQFSGITALGYYTQTIFHQSGSSLSPAQSSMICTAMQVVILSVGSLALDRFGRKPLYIVSTSGAAILLIIMGIYLTLQDHGYDLSSFLWIPIIIMVLYNVIGAIGFLMITNILPGELLSVSIKSKALGIVNMYLGVCLCVVSKLIQALSSSFGMCTPFFLFGACSMLSGVFYYYCVPETKGISLEVIQQKLKRKTNSAKFSDNK